MCRSWKLFSFRFDLTMLLFIYIYACIYIKQRNVYYVVYLPCSSISFPSLVFFRSNPLFHTLHFIRIHQHLFINCQCLYCSEPIYIFTYNKKKRQKINNYNIDISIWHAKKHDTHTNRNSEKLFSFISFPFYFSFCFSFYLFYFRAYLFVDSLLSVRILHWKINIDTNWIKQMIDAF